MKKLILTGFLFSLIFAAPPSRAASDAVAEWAGAGTYRLLVRVDPIDIGGRTSDEMPAELSIDLKAELAKLRRGPRVLDPILRRSR